MRLRSAPQPCICYLLPVNGVKRECLLRWEKLARTKRVTNEELVETLIIMNTSSTASGSRCDSVTLEGKLTHRKARSLTRPSPLGKVDCEARRMRLQCANLLNLTHHFVVPPPQRGVLGLACGLGHLGV